MKNFSLLSAAGVVVLIALGLAAGLWLDEKRQEKLGA